jgi:hypothetical protein
MRAGAQPAAERADGDALAAERGLQGGGREPGSRRVEIDESTLWSSAWRQAAAQIPAWRREPPSRCFQRHAWPMNASEPASTAPSGAPSPLVKSSQTLSNPAPMAAGAIPDATQAFMSRAPSMWVAQPCSRAMPVTSTSVASGQIVPPPIFAVCSISSSAWGGA